MTGAGRLVLAATAAFWVAVAGFGIAAWRAGGDAATGAATGTETGTATAAAAPASAPVSAAELARHASADDCWLAIDGQVYDLTAYLPRHPADEAVLLAWCGKEASAAYRRKGQPGAGQPHSARADALLPRYRVAPLAETR